jgi:NifB/MoaA-like Fe-S oxidoreductase
LQLLLIDKGAGLQVSTEAAIRELALSTLEKNTAFFNLHRQPLPWPPRQDPFLGLQGAHSTFLEEHSIEIDTITGLLHDAITQCWLNKVRELQEKEKAALLVQEATQ